MEAKKIGWIGTGVMGKSICEHIIKNGHNLFIYNRTKEKAQDLIENGAKWCESPKELAKECDIIFTMVGFPDDVKEVILGEKGALKEAKENSVIIDMTTSKPDLAKKIYEECKLKNVHSLDCPVTGGDQGAKNGTLTIFCGGNRKAYEEVLDILKLFGKTIDHVGEAGSGQHAKMANQISIAAGMIGICETLIYSKKANLDLKKIIEMVGNGSAGSWQMKSLGARIIENNYDPGFYIKHFIKDLGIALEECEKMNLNLPGLNLANNLYLKAQESGYENLGTQALYKLFDN